MVNPKLMCREHLLGEFRELKMFVGTLRKQNKIDNYIKHNCLEIKNLVPRWAELRDEMLRRNYKPKAVIREEDLILNHLTEEHLRCFVPREWSLNKLFYNSRKEKNGCIHCQEMYQKFLKEFPGESPYSKLPIPPNSSNKLKQNGIKK